MMMLKSGDVKLRLRGRHVAIVVVVVVAIVGLPLIYQLLMMQLPMMSGRRMVSVVVVIDIVAVVQGRLWNCVVVNGTIVL